MISELERLVPAPGQGVDWRTIQSGRLAFLPEDLSRVRQDETHHGEGDVWTHTRLVCDALVGLPRWRALDAKPRQALFVAALLHDMGKTTCTRVENGRLTAPRHAAAGERAARVLLWQLFGLCGEREAMCFRETVCALVRWHGAPIHFMDRPDPALDALRLASLGGLADCFSLEALALLSEADVRGRVCGDAAELLDAVELFRVQAAEAGCLTAPFDFPSSRSRYACLCGRGVTPGQPLHDAAWGEVLVLAGLPGTGKDTYLNRFKPEVPMVSLDTERRAMGVLPTENQSAVAAAAREQARVCLRRRQPFAWNATNLTPETRRKIMSLIEQYGASARVIYLETTWALQLERNRSRPHAVPEAALERMLSILKPPTLTEAQRVEWLCV